MGTGPGVRPRPEREPDEGWYAEGVVVGVELRFERGDEGRLVVAVVFDGVGGAVAADDDGFD